MEPTFETERPGYKQQNKTISDFPNLPNRRINKQLTMHCFYCDGLEQNPFFQPGDWRMHFLEKGCKKDDKSAVFYKKAKNASPFLVTPSWSLILFCCLCVSFVAPDTIFLCWQLIVWHGVGDEVWRQPKDAKCQVTAGISHSQRKHRSLFQKTRLSCLMPSAALEWTLLLWQHYFWNNKWFSGDAFWRQAMNENANFDW